MAHEESISIGTSPSKRGMRIGPLINFPTSTLTSGRANEREVSQRSYRLTQPQLAKRQPRFKKLQPEFRWGLLKATHICFPSYLHYHYPTTAQANPTGLERIISNSGGAF